ncbi:pantothenate permease [Salinibacter sp. 10B]|uniref:sodium:solute symporter family protein n=1 Tax=Salinibacter sp. 10B TaxID=1923971 RepID=UPI000CF443A3|nr:sodium:solute symporter family protein [Salinibacter sp. 10B]PQJ34628.1 pantothenate permease [Salinibacter sp. 10B]
MEAWVVILLVCGGYLVLALGLGVWSGRTVSKSVTGYVAGDRTLGTLVLYFVLGASVFSSFAFLGAPGWAYSRGAAAFYIIAYGAVGMVPFYFLGPRARRVGEALGFVTQAEMLAHRYNSQALSVVLAVLSVVVFVPYLTLQMKGAGFLLATISNGHVPQWLGALVAYGVVLVYVFASGMMAIGWTNTLQGIFMMIVAWFLGLYLPFEFHGGVQPMFEAIAASDLRDMLIAPGLAADGSAWTWAGYSSAVVVSAVGFSVWPHLFMRAFTARSERTLKLTVVLYPTFQLFLVPILLIGFAGVLPFPDVAPADTIVPHLLTEIDLSPVLVGLVCAGALAASMSSGDAILHAAASIGLRDGIKPLVSGEMTDRRQRQWIRGLVVAISAAAYYFAVFSEVGIVALLLGAYGGVAQIFPLVFAAFYWPRATGAGALSGLLTGVSVNTLFLVAPTLRPFPLHEGVYGLIANLLVFVTVSLLTSPHAEARVAHYTPLHPEASAAG